ncbi:MAG: glyoxalase/bleomycin resistance protein/dioxygenase [Rhodospirillales bacterium]|nr:glyoxalase/bleomycin resistance protein/dioxygenase [Rhodospirillales bacterium]
MEPRISLITLGVADISRARRFYESLGWTASGASNDNVVFFQLAALCLSLYGRAALVEDAHLPNAGSGFGGVALAHNVRAREDVDHVLNEAREAGGTILRPAEDAFWGGYSGYFADPDGHPWEVAWNPHFTILEDGTIRIPT